MAAITIADLHLHQTLDGKAMSAVKGGGAPWVFGWIRPYVPRTDNGLGPAVNFYQINNYYADQMINQFQVVNINNSAANSNIKVGLDEHSANAKLPAGA